VRRSGEKEIDEGESEKKGTTKQEKEKKRYLGARHTGKITERREEGWEKKEEEQVAQGGEKYKSRKVRV